MDDFLITEIKDVADSSKDVVVGHVVAIAPTKRRKSKRFSIEMVKKHEQIHFTLVESGTTIINACSKSVLRTAC